MRRSIKPFTVEVRRSGRKPKPSPSGQVTIVPQAPADAEQPHLPAWPGSEGMGDSQDLIPAVAAPVPGRVLLALDEPAPADAPEEAEAVEQDHSFEGGGFEDDGFDIDLDSDDGEPDPGNGADGQPVPPSVPVSDGTEAGSPGKPRRSRARLPRAAFKREDRWKARLPAAVHRAGRRPRHV